MADEVEKAGDWLSTGLSDLGTGTMEVITLGAYDENMDLGSEYNNLTDTIGLTDNAGEEEAKKIAEAQRERAEKIGDEQIAFQREQYDKWQSIYGPIQEDLGTYFKNLNGKSLSNKQVTQLQKSSQDAQKMIGQQLAQRGLADSGLAAQAMMQNTFSTEQAKANVRANADDIVNQQKMNFLGLGLGQGTQMLGTQAGLGSNIAGQSANMSNTALNSATSIGMQNTMNMSDFTGSAIGAAMQYYGGK